MLFCVSSALTTRSQNYFKLCHSFSFYSFRCCCCCSFSVPSFFFFFLSVEYVYLNDIVSWTQANESDSIVRKNSWFKFKRCVIFRWFSYIAAFICYFHYEIFFFFTTVFLLFILTQPKIILCCITGHAETDEALLQLQPNNTKLRLLKIIIKWRVKSGERVEHDANCRMAKYCHETS